MDKAKREEFLKNTTVGDLTRIAQERGVRGKVAVAEGLIDHTEAATVGHGTNTKWRKFNDPTPEQMRAEFEADLPPTVVRTARQRYVELLLMLKGEAERAPKDETGRPIWPASFERILSEIRGIGWRAGKPALADDVEDLARHFFEKAARQQVATDGKKVALDWSGHDNTSITVSTGRKAGARQKGS